jgi:hypothetical protein
VELQIAAENAAGPLARLLMAAGADPAIGGKRSPLHSAAKKGSTEVCTALLRAGAPIDGPNGVDEQTAIGEAAHDGRIDVVLLLLRHGAQVGLERGLVGLERALWLAVMNGHEDVVRAITPHFLSPNAPYNGQLHRLSSLQNWPPHVKRVIVALLDADPDPQAKDASGKVSLEVACSSCAREELERMLVPSLEASHANKTQRLTGVSQ